jgi:hypothetical protein
VTIENLPGRIIFDLDTGSKLWQCPSTTGQAVRTGRQLPQGGRMPRVAVGSVTTKSWYQDQLARKRHNRFIGLCQCGRIPRENRRKCVRCAEWDNCQSVRRQMRCGSGVCRCGQAITDDKLVCEICLGSNRNRKRTNRVAGRCSCGQLPRPDRKSCARCAEHQKNYRQKKTAEAKEAECLA